MEHTGEGAKECAARRRVTTAEEERRREEDAFFAAHVSGPGRWAWAVGLGGRPDMGTKLS